MNKGIQCLLQLSSFTQFENHNEVHLKPDLEGVGYYMGVGD